jgi:hypothetical protein
MAASTPKSPYAHGRRLPSTVGSQEANHVSLGNFKRDVGDASAGAVALGETMRLHECVQFSSCLRATLGAWLGDDGLQAMLKQAMGALLGLPYRQAYVRRCPVVMGPGSRFVRESATFIRDIIMRILVIPL